MLDRAFGDVPCAQTRGLARGGDRRSPRWEKLRHLQTGKKRDRALPHDPTGAVATRIWRWLPGRASEGIVDRERPCCGRARGRSWNAKNKKRSNDCRSTSSMSPVGSQILYWPNRTNALYRSPDGRSRRHVASLLAIARRLDGPRAAENG